MKLMKTTNLSQFRTHLASMLDAVNDDREPLLVTRQGGAAAVVMSADEYAAIETTLHLLRSPANIRRLRESIDELDRGEGTERQLVADG